MSKLPREMADWHQPGPAPLSSTAAVVLALSFGLAGGYLDLLIIVLREVLLEPRGVLPHCA